MPIHCEIASPDGMVFQGDVDIVVLPGAAGEIGVLPKHAPMLTILRDGVVRVRAGGMEQDFPVAGGVAEVLRGNVTVLAESAEWGKEIA